MSLDTRLRPLLTAILNHLDCALILVDTQHTVLFANRLFYELWQRSADEILGHNIREIRSSLQHLLADPQGFHDLVATTYERQESVAGLEVALADGRIIEFDYAPVFLEETFIGHLWQMRDITARKMAESEALKGKHLLELFFSQSMDGCFFMLLDEPVTWNDTVDKEQILDYVFAHQRLTRVNEALAAQYGATPDQLLGKTPGDLFSRNLPYAKSVWHQFFDAGRLRLDTAESKLDGSEIWIEGDYICLYDDQGRITGHFGLQRDVTDRKQAEEAIRHQAYHDALTGLPNRILFQDRLGIAITQAERDGWQMALLFLDCYQFKQINDKFGHLCGDHLLRIVADRLTECVRKGDTVARLGGDEFVIILPRIKNHEEASLVAQRILTYFRQPISLQGGLAAQLGASIGISLFPSDATTADQLLAAADRAMYNSKQFGSHAYSFYQTPIEK